MTRLRRGADRVHALESAFEKPVDLSKGQLIPDVSLHSDVFAMGCLAYFLASDGRNPERFWRQYLDELALQAFAATLPIWVTNSPLWLACALCIDHPGQIKKDLKAFWRAMTSDRRRTLDGSEHADEHYATVISSLSSLPRLAGDSAHIARFRNGVHGNDALSQLLKDRDGDREVGNPISLPFLVIVCLCCMRDKAGSIVKRNPESSRGETTQGVGFVYASNESSFSASLVDIATQVGQLPSFRQPDSSPFTDFGAIPLDQFVRLRFAATRVESQDKAAIAAATLSSTQTPTAGTS